MEKDIIKIVFSSDNNFVEQLAVAITSLVQNSKDEFLFYILDGGINEENKKKLKNLYSSIEFIKINFEDFKNCPLSKHFKLPAYFRIKLPSLLNENKILYLDCDIICKTSIKNLYETNIQNVYCAAVEDFTKNLTSTKNQVQNLNIKNYFNDGITLFNLKKMREDKIEEKCFGFIKKYPQKIKNVDQCVLNAVFQNKVVFVDSLWNFQYNNVIFDIKKQFFKNYKNIKILHFACENKPWDFKNLHPATLIWYHYLSKTEFKKPFLWVIKNIINCFIRKIKLSFVILTSIF